MQDKRRTASFVTLNERELLKDLERLERRLEDQEDNLGPWEIIGWAVIMFFLLLIAVIIPALA